MQPLPIDDPPPTEHTLADQLDLDVLAFVETFGAGWTEAPVMHDFDADPSGGWERPFEPWHVAGHPAQLMLRVSIETIELAVPRGEWRELGRVTLVPSHVISLPRPLDPAGCEAVVKELLRRRRASLFFCRYCRVLTPPEYRQSAGVCMGCASEWLGVVY